MSLVDGLRLVIALAALAAAFWTAWRGLGR